MVPPKGFPLFEFERACEGKDEKDKEEVLNGLYAWSRPRNRSTAGACALRVLNMLPADEDGGPKGLLLVVPNTEGPSPAPPPKKEEEEGNCVKASTGFFCRQIGHVGFPDNHFSIQLLQKSLLHL